MLKHHLAIGYSPVVVVWLNSNASSCAIVSSAAVKSVCMHVHTLLQPQCWPCYSRLTLVWGLWAVLHLEGRAAGIVAVSRGDLPGVVPTRQHHSDYCHVLAGWANTYTASFGIVITAGCAASSHMPMCRCCHSCSAGHAPASSSKYMYGDYG